MKKFGIISNSVFAFLVMLFDVLYICFPKLIFKSIASIMFVLQAGVNLYLVFKFKFGNLKYSILMLLGLFVAMLGDIILNLNFIGGAVLFALGHVIFFISYIYLYKFKYTDLICGAIVFIPSLLFITIYDKFDFGGVLMEIVCVVYALVISLMVGTALSNSVVNKSISSIILAIGSVLFFFSDLMLLLNVFGDFGKITDILCLVTYYPAEILLALSILLSGFVPKSKEEKKIE